MNDEHDDEPMNEPMNEPSADDAHIRALLAELGSGPDGRPMPPEVAARLDDTLARLVAERATRESPRTSTGDPDERASAGTTSYPSAVAGCRGRPLPRPPSWSWARAASRSPTSASSATVPRCRRTARAAPVTERWPRSAQADGGSVPNANPSSPTSGDTALVPERTTGGCVRLPEISATSFESDVTHAAAASPLVGRGRVAPTSGSESGDGADYAEKSPSASPSPRTRGAKQGPPAR